MSSTINMDVGEDDHSWQLDWEIAAFTIIALVLVLYFTQSVLSPAYRGMLLFRMAYPKNTEQSNAHKSAEKQTKAIRPFGCTFLATK